MSSLLSIMDGFVARSRALVAAKFDIVLINKCISIYIKPMPRMANKKKMVLDLIESGYTPFLELK